MLDKYGGKLYFWFKVTGQRDLRKRVGSAGKKGEKSSELHRSNPIRFLILSNTRATSDG